MKLVQNLDKLHQGGKILGIQNEKLKITKQRKNDGAIQRPKNEDEWGWY